MSDYSIRPNQKTQIMSKLMSNLMSHEQSSIFVDIAKNNKSNSATHNIPIFMIDVSGSTEDQMYYSDGKKYRIVDYEFILVNQISQKEGYTKSNIICWSSNAKTYLDIDPQDIDILDTIKIESHKISSGTHILSGFKQLMDIPYDQGKITDLYILTDGELGDSKSDFEKSLRKLSLSHNDNLNIKIIAVEKGKKDYTTNNCEVGNILFRYIRECKMVRLVSSFSIYNTLHTEFINFSNPKVPEGYAPYIDIINNITQMFKISDFTTFMKYVDMILNDIEKDKIFRFTHSISLPIYHCTKHLTIQERMGIVEIFSSMYKRFANDTIIEKDKTINIYEQARELLISEVNNHISGMSTTFTESKKQKHIKIENTNLDLMENVKKSITHDFINTQKCHSFLIRHNTPMTIIFDHNVELTSLTLDKAKYNYSSTQIYNNQESYTIPLIFELGNGDDKRNSCIQWVRILYSRILGVSPSNPYIWLYLASDALFIDTHTNADNSNEAKQLVYQNYVSYINAFMNEEITGTDQTRIQRIMKDNKISIQHHILQGLSSYSGIKLKPFSLFALIVYKFVLPHFPKTNQDMIKNFTKAINSFCLYHLVDDLDKRIINDSNDSNDEMKTKYDDVINMDHNTIIQTLMTKISNTKNMIHKIYDCQTADSAIIPKHNITDTNIECPQRYVKLTDSDTDKCNLCGSTIQINIIKKSDTKILEEIFDNIHHNENTKSMVIDDSKFINLGLLDGSDDSGNLISPDNFGTNNEYMKCDNIMIVDPLSSSKLRIKTQEEFIRSVELKYPYIKELDMNNVVLAGGFVRSILLKQEMKDFDFFMYGLENDIAYTDRFNKLLIDLMNNILSHYAKQGIRVKFGMFFKPMFNVFEVICYEDPTNHIDSDFTLENFHSYKYRSLKRYVDPDADNHVRSKNKPNDKFYFEDGDTHGIRMKHRIQIVMCKFKTKEDVLKSFDLYPSKVLYDGNRVHFTDKSLLAYQYMVNEIRLLGGSCLFKHRINKYFKYGFSIVFPPNKRDWMKKNHDNDYTQQDTSYSGTNENRGPLFFKVRKIYDNVIVISHNSNIEKMLERNQQLEEEAKNAGDGLYISTLFCSFVSILRYIDINNIDYSFPQFNIVKNSQNEILECEKITMQHIGISKEEDKNIITFKTRKLQVSFIEKFNTLYTTYGWYEQFYKSVILSDY